MEINDQHRAACWMNVKRGVENGSITLDQSAEGRKAVISMHNGTNQPLIEVKDLKEYFNISMGMFKSKPLKAVDGVSFTINKGETLGLVGESGCGKTTVGRTILHLYKPTAGEIWYDGKKIETKADIHDIRKKATMVFQDPYSSLNPRMTVADIIGEPLDVHKLYQSRSGRTAF